MKLASILFSAILLLLATTLSYAGPFGTRMGEPKEEFTDLKPIESENSGVEMYYTSKMPKRHSLFQQYILKFGDTGLVSIIAISKLFDNDRASLGALSAYDNLKKQLTEKYGEPKNLEFLHPNGIWKKDNEFAMSLVKNERQHTCDWTKNLPDDLKRIRLAIIGESGDCVKICLLYEYINIEMVNAILEKVEKDSL